MNAGGVAAQLQQAGYATYTTPQAARVWFELAPNARPLLLAQSPWVTAVAPGAASMRATLQAAGAPPAPIAPLNLQDVTATGAVRQRLRNDSPLQVMQLWSDHFVSRTTPNVIQLLDTLFLPELTRRWPHSTVCFVGPTARTSALTSLVRAHGLREILSWQALRGAAGVQGFPVLRAIHTGIGASASTFLNLMSAHAFPHHRIWVIPRLPGELVIILGEEVRLQPAASNEREFACDPLETAYLAPGNAVRFHQPAHPAGASEALGYIDETVAKLNDLFEAALSIHTRFDDRRKADVVASLKLLFVLERIAQSFLVVSTSQSEYVRMNECFGLIDLIASLATSKLQNRIDALPQRAGVSQGKANKSRQRLSRNKEPALGDALISDATFQALVQPALQTWACAACARLVPTAQQRQQDIHVAADQSFFAANRNRRGVSIRFREIDEDTGRRGAWRTRTVGPTALAGQLVRQLRNTHHGYDLRDELFEGLLALSHGGIGDHLPSYLEHVWLAILGAPARWLGGGLAQTVHLPRAVG